jgi:hypothetical protein
MTKNFEAFLKMDTGRYANQYVILINRRVVMSGLDLPSMIKRVRKRYPRQTPLVAKIPQRGALVLVSL